MLILIRFRIGDVRDGALEKMSEQGNAQTGWGFTEMHFLYRRLMAYLNNNEKCSLYNPSEINQFSAARD